MRVIGVETAEDGVKHDVPVAVSHEGEVHTLVNRIEDVCAILTQLMQTMNRPTWLYQAGGGNALNIYPIGGVVSTISSITSFGYVQSHKPLTDMAWAAGVGRLIT